MDISISKARENNLKAIDLKIPRNKLTVITGVSGSGKSSLAFDTIHAEAYRRYIDTLPLFARQFVKILKKPDVDYIYGLSPSIAVEQKGRTSHSGRSTVGTITDINSYIRLLYAKQGKVVCVCGNKTQSTSEASLLKYLLKHLTEGDKVQIMAPLDFETLESTIERFIIEGFTKITVKGKEYRLEELDSVDIGEDLQDVSLNIDSIKFKNNIQSRVLRGIELAYKISSSVKIYINGEFIGYWGKKNVCKVCGRMYPKFEPKHFSFNTPYGACPDCDGTGYIDGQVCSTCNGTRLKQDVLSVYIDNLNIFDLQELSVDSVYSFLSSYYSNNKNELTDKIIPVVLKRLEFLKNVGLSYLSLNRPVNTLSGGEFQRVRLATQLGLGLQNVIYVLDEPSIGLHPSDNEKLISALKRLRDMGNTVIVVEHDEEMIRNADYIVDLGPGAGVYGGKVEAKGTLDEVLKTNTLTAKYLSKEIKIPTLNELAVAEKYITLHNVKTHNLKNITVKFPIGLITTVTGVSGSGKSSLVIDTLLPNLKKLLEKQDSDIKVSGVENIDRVIYVDQKPIGRSYRSNPASYVGILANIRELLAAVPEARALGLNASSFSFNADGGRCEKCEGSGLEKIELRFMPPVYVTCSVCKGERFKENILSVRYKGANIYDILEMTVSEAREFFKNIKKIKQKLDLLHDVGLSYLKLGQSSVSLSGGESQRIKLAKELSKRASQKTLYILDEPTTGLHFADIHKLLDILYRFRSRGASIIIIEHNPDVMRASDYIVDLGPEGGDKGGYVLYQGPLNMLKDSKDSKTALFV